MQRKESILAQRLKFLRESRSITTYELSKKSGITETTLKAYENGLIRSPSVDNIIILCECFNCTADYLLGLKDSIELSAGALEIARIYDSMKDYEQSWSLLLMEAIWEKMESLRRQKHLDPKFLANVLNAR